ncbi:preprotein translocase subunit SecA [Ruminococcaceae bacterium CPB6]|jgi:preprotein translocase subunit SecA|uniref:Protein translocase subunit SecA n=1 Tax=Caproicibacterium lactatifermentans TaxID=2666138 RepID=A0A859DML3_9FIRM|nr:preprotein translocase subunit SecA [Caproicibacterium lactatifermentans]ARP49487.1 preprotein translocase subunit SecA [Ruminococcaceae bacterium CPB6]QKN23078.1 preprotein translocase subunit SecA [Caproicibacterium lactatifermentans]
MPNNILSRFFGNYSKRELKRIQPMCDAVISKEDKYKALSDTELQAQTPALKERLADGESVEDILPDAFAVCREASARVLGMRHFPVQVLGGIVLHQGRIAEMKTGEGKTLVATLPAYLNGLTGKGVHIVTVNDYLARRDSEWMGKVYRFLGLSVGLITHEMDSAARKEAYNADITYGTNNEFGFDYLRDNMVIYKEDKVQRGHHFAIVDEVDSILVDEARTPLIISGPGEKSTEMYTVADRFVQTLKMVKVAELNDKEDNDALYTDADYIVDEKAKTATLTPSGVKKTESYFHVDNLTDAENIGLQHYVNQAIKARGVMTRDVDYVVKDGEVIIVDEFTGRLMYGRRYNEGLHQAIEAKEGVQVARESKTLATITFQNYFRLYSKLSGMTGTAMTEEDEFREIYKLDVVEIPTNKPMIRKDLHDVVYKTEKAKFNAVIDDVEEHHKTGQPVLVGTISIDKSEQLSKLLKQRGIKHVVLNAKYHEKEAEIVAQAGKKGAVTIATNMAGRGTDIMLGGNSEYMAKSEMRRMGFSSEMVAQSTAYGETDNKDILNARKTYSTLEDKYKKEIKPEADEVRKAGGLYIIGTERHESRRIDNQLRGRSGRQGDPGMSRFYISLEDDLMRLFGGERVSAMMETLKVDEDTPIENKMLTKTIENAQRRIEGRNFAIRKDVLKYDDVNSRQREVIYKQRDQVLDGADVHEQIMGMVKQAIENQVKVFLPMDETNIDNPRHDWNMDGLRDRYMGWLLKQGDLSYTEDELKTLKPEDVTGTLYEKAEEICSVREEKFGKDVCRELERVVLLKNVDTEWMDHIDSMEELQRGIRLRAYGQKDPVVEYRMESYDMFDAMIDAIRENTARMLLTVRLQTAEEPQREQVMDPTAASGAEGTTDDHTAPEKHKGHKIGRNELCPCGSGLKWKKCTCAKYHPQDGSQPYVE